jgi:tetratricopeptide (TPR) repeat protein
MKLNIKKTLQQAIAAHKEGKLQDAERLYLSILQSYPNHPEANQNLGVLETNKLIQLFQNSQYDEAIKLGQSLTERFPKHQFAWKILGVVLGQTGRHSEALNASQTAAALPPQDAQVHYNLGVTLKELGRLDEAEASYRQAIVLQPDNDQAHNNLGITLKELGRLDEAEVSYRQAIALQPGYAQPHNNLGVTLQELGRLDEAEASYRQAIDLQPDNANAHRHLTLMKKFESQDEQFLKMQELYLDENTTEKERYHINFGLAKACEDLGDFKKAFIHYSEGNALRKKLLNYDTSQDEELFKQIKSNYRQIKQNTLKSEKLEKSLIPIFIVGMPRSGTTLVEQIISSHSQVTGAGELAFIRKFGNSISTGLSQVSTEILLKFRQQYLSECQKISKDNKIVTDKMPHNFLYIGLIATAFPEAKIVHVKRDPAAVSWANFKQYFSSKELGYCYALDDIISYYGLYENLMEFWESSLGKIIYNLDYELLTVNQENETRNLIEFLGLDWDEKCLSPQNNTRGVSTASNTQVRKKVYQGSSQQWKKYEPFLSGAFDIFK